MPELDTRLVAGPWWLQKEPDTFIQTLQAGAHMAAQKKEYEQNALRLNLARQEMELRSQAQQLQARQIEKNMEMAALGQQDAADIGRWQSEVNINPNAPLPSLRTIPGQNALSERALQLGYGAAQRNLQKNLLESESILMQYEPENYMAINSQYKRGTPEYWQEVLKFAKDARVAEDRRKVGERIEIAQETYGARYPTASGVGQVEDIHDKEGKVIGVAFRNRFGEMVNPHYFKTDWSMEKRTKYQARASALAKQILLMEPVEAEKAWEDLDREFSGPEQNAPQGNAVPSGSPSDPLNLFSAPKK